MAKNKKQLRDPYHNDVDYWSRLPEAARAWLRRYQSDLRGVPAAGKRQVPKTPQQRRQMNNQAYVARQDIFTRGKRASVEAVPEGAQDPTQELIEELDEKRLFERFDTED